MKGTKGNYPLVKCDDCQFYQEKDSMGIMYCNRSKMPIVYKEFRNCLVKQKISK